jgi:hypothetical protein
MPTSPQPTSTSRAALEAGVTALRARAAADPRVAVRGKAACLILGCSPSQLANFVRDGEVVSFLDHASRLFPVAQLYQRMINKMLVSNPEGAPAVKARQPATMFTKGAAPPPRTAKQLQALAEGNRIRIQRARSRREHEPA